MGSLTDSVSVSNTLLGISQLGKHIHNQGMDAKTCRTLNIRRAVADAGGPAGFVARYGSGRWVAAQVSQWTSETNPKGIGHALARDLEAAIGLAPGSLDRPPEQASHSGGLDLAKLAAATEFLEDLFAAEGKQFIASQQTMLVARVYSELLDTSTPNLVEMAARFGRTVRGEDERQGQTGSTGKDHRGGTGEGAGKAKAAAGKRR